MTAQILRHTHAIALKDECDQHDISRFDAERTGGQPVNDSTVAGTSVFWTILPSLISYFRIKVQEVRKIG